MAKSSLSHQPQGSSESNRPTVSLSRLCLFPPGGAAGVPKSCRTTSGSSELSEGAGGKNRRVHVVLPWLECVDPLAGPQAQGQRT